MYQLRPYQIEDVQKASSTGLIINANEPGLGKTLETLVTIQQAFPGRTLVITPKMATGVWSYEAQKWLNWDSLGYTGDYKKEERKMIRQAYDDVNSELFIINAAMMKETQDWRPVWDNIVVDEAHLIGLLNHKSKNFDTLQHFKYRHIFLLTGTPIRKGPDDLYPMLHLLNPKVFRAYWPFVNRYCVVVQTPFGKEIQKQPKDPMAFKEMLDRYMFRRRKKDVLQDLPEKERQVYTLDALPMQQKLHKQLIDEMYILDPTLIVVQNMLTLSLRLRQLLVCPKLLGIDCYGAAIDLLATLLVPEEFAAGRSVVISTVFREAIPFIAERLKQEIPDIKIEIIHGQIKEAASSVAQRFQEIPTHKKVLIYTVKSGASWTATAASTGFMLGYDWSAINNIQAEDRIHRIGQTNKVHWYYLVYKGTIDENVMHRLDERAMTIGWTLTPELMREQLMNRRKKSLHQI